MHLILDEKGDRFLKQKLQFKEMYVCEFCVVVTLF